MKQTVECCWLGAFKILALVEHPNWVGGIIDDGEDRNKGNGQNEGQVSPESREFAILIMDGRAPILSPDNLQIVHLIPVVGNSFNCDIGKKRAQFVYEIIIIWASAGSESFPFL